MNDYYKIEPSLIKDISDSLRTEKIGFSEGTSRTFYGSYLPYCNDSDIIQMSKKIGNHLSLISKAYDSLGTWLSNYSNDVNNVESGLSLNAYNIKDSATTSAINTVLTYKEAKIEKSPTVIEDIKNGKDGVENTIIIDASKEQKYDENLEYSPDKIDPLELYKTDRKKFIEIYGVEGLNIIEIYPAVVDGEEIIKKKLDDKESEVRAAFLEYDRFSKTSGRASIGHDKELCQEAKKEYEKLKEEQEEIKAQLAEMRMYKKEIYISLCQQYYDYNILNLKEFNDFTINFDLEEEYIEQNYVDIDRNVHLGGLFDEKKDRNLVPYIERFFSKYNADINDTSTLTFSVAGVLDEKIGKDGYQITIKDFYIYTEDSKNRYKRLIYNYLYKNKGKDAADEYIKVVADDVNMYVGTKNAEVKIKEIANYYETFYNDPNYIMNILGGIASYFNVKVEALADGIGNFFEGLSYATDIFGEGSRLISPDEYEKLAFLKYLQENTDYLDIVYSINSTVGRMVPAIGTSLLLNVYGITSVGWLPATLSGVSSTGTSYHYDMTNGKSKAQALKYAIIVGCSDAVADYLIGTIPGIGKASGFSFRNMVKNGVSETVESYIAEIAKGVKGEEIDLGSVTKDALGTFIYSAFISGYTNLGAVSIHVVYNGKNFTDVELTDIKNAYLLLSTANPETVDLQQVLEVAALHTRTNNSDDATITYTPPGHSSDSGDRFDERGRRITDGRNGQNTKPGEGYYRMAKENAEALGLKDVKAFTRFTNGKEEVVTMYKVNKGGKEMYVLNSELLGTYEFDSALEVDDFRKDEELLEFIDQQEVDERVKRKIEESKTNKEGK